MEILRLHEKIRKFKSLFISISAIFIGIVYVFTILISIYIPQTRGFFNLGEIGVYIAAIIGGPYIGGIAGGIGSCMADITLGYSYYAPGTLIIKGLEGFIVGILVEYFLSRPRKLSRGIVIAAIIIITFLLYFLGSNLYIGSAELTILIGSTILVNINEIVWLAISVLFALISLYVVVKYPEISTWILAMVSGGAEMILGYYLYEQYILGYLAVAEVPFNTMQVLIGIFGTSIILQYIRRLRL